MTDLAIFDVLRAGGMTVSGAEGTMANLRAESAMRSNNVEDRCPLSDEDYTFLVDNDPSYDFATDCGANYGYGYAQWTEPRRKRKLLAAARARGASIADEGMQLAFLLREMQADFPAVWQVVSSSDDLKACTEIVLNVYENPAEKNLGLRYLYAQEFAAKFSGARVDDPPAKSDLAVKLLQLAMSHDGYWPPGEITGVKTPAFRQRIVEYAQDVAAC